MGWRLRVGAGGIGAIALCLLGVVLLGGQFARADEAGAQAEQEQVVRGTVMATWCDAMEGSAGIALRNSSGQRNCIYRGSPIGIKEGERVYLVSHPDAAMKKQLIPLLGRRAAAYGIVSRKQSQLAIQVSRIEPER